MPAAFTGEGLTLFTAFLGAHVTLGRANRTASEAADELLRLRGRFRASLDDGQDLAALHLHEQAEARLETRLEECNRLIALVNDATERLAEWWLEQPEGPARLAQREEALEARRNAEALWQDVARRLEELKG
jgi:hypothetical protein